MPFIQSLLQFVLHLDTHLTEITSAYGWLTYLILFGIVFAETGFVITPFLPGDSVLFAAGAIAALGSLSLPWLMALLIVAAIVGDTINYWIGHYFGQKIVSHKRSPLKPEHLKKTQDFYAKHGGKTIILARFIPIVRTFAPFVAGIGTMNYRQFIVFNVAGAVIWVTLFTLAGYFFGNIPAVKHNFSLVILIIIALSVVPVIYEFIKAKREA